LATIQLDFQLAKRFGAEYIDKRGKKKNPILIHAAIFGSFERFIGILLEHYAGALPLWLSPIQVAILPISEKHIGFAEKIKEKLLEKDFRVEINGENETLSKKILEAETQKIPYIIVVGDKEVQANKISLRERGKGNIGSVSTEKFIEILEEKRENKK